MGDGFTNEASLSEKQHMLASVCGVGSCAEVLLQLNGLANHLIPSSASGHRLFSPPQLNAVQWQGLPHMARDG